MKWMIGAVSMSLLLGLSRLAFADDEPPPPPAPPATATAPTLDAAPAGDHKEKKKTPEEMLEESSKQLAEASKKLDDVATKLAPKSTEPKVLLEGRLPWNGVAVKLAEKDKKATVAASWSLWAGIATLGLELTAPLDEDTRRAALLEERGSRPAAFQFKLSMEYNDMKRALADFLNMDPKAQATWDACQQYLQERNLHGRMCPLNDDPDFKKWRDENLLPGTRDGVFSRSIPGGVRFTLGAELTGSLDRQDVYDSDIAAEAKEKTKWNFAANAVARFYPGRTVAIPIRVGFKVDDGFKAKEFDRCTTLTSTDAAISGKQCEKALLLASDKDVEASAFVDAAVVFVPAAPFSWELRPGVEARARIDGIGATKMAHVFATLFVAPTDQPIASRFGVGVEYVRALDDDSGASPSFRAGDVWFVPFILAGGSL